jgi:hypothetical protein
MASGLLLEDGQVWVLDAMKASINTAGGLYVGLMSNSTKPSETNQLPSDITEITGSGYARQLSSTWLVSSGVNPYIQGSMVTFTASGNWSNVNGYFVSESLTGNDALWAELFPIEKVGNRSDGDTILLTPVYEQKNQYE